MNLIIGVSSIGEFFYTINHGRTNATTFLFFLTKLVKHLSESDTNWREKTVLLIDNAPYHRSKMIMDKYLELNLPLMFFGPY